MYTPERNDKRRTSIHVATRNSIKKRGNQQTQTDFRNGSKGKREKKKYMVVKMNQSDIYDFNSAYST